MKDAGPTHAEVLPYSDAEPLVTKARTEVTNQVRSLRITVIQLREKIEALNIATLDDTQDRLDGITQVLDDINNELHKIQGAQL